MAEQLDHHLERVVETIKPFVEFLQQGGPKPHVVFRLNINPAIEIDRRMYKGCRLSMDFDGNYEGAFNLAPLPYDTTSHAAHAAFEFQLEATNWTVANILNAITYPVDLTDFSFVGGFRIAGESTEYVDGCRDFISQVFINLHKSGLVRWHIHRIDRGVFDGTNLDVRNHRTGFHEIIGYKYLSPSNGALTRITSLPLARGIFHANYFSRVLSYQADDGHRFLLPYHPSEPQEGDEEYTPTSSSVGSSSVSSSSWTMPLSTQSSTSESYFFVSNEIYYWMENGQAREVERPVGQWVYNERGWSATSRQRRWRMVDANGAITYQ